MFVVAIVIYLFIFLINTLRISATSMVNLHSITQNLCFLGPCKARLHVSSGGKGASFPLLRKAEAAQFLLS